VPLAYPGHRFVESEGRDPSLPFADHAEFERAMECMHLAGSTDAFLDVSKPVLGLGIPGDFGPYIAKVRANQGRDGNQGGW
jgi:hypothetical protein